MREKLIKEKSFRQREILIMKLNDETDNLWEIISDEKILMMKAL